MSSSFPRTMVGGVSLPRMIVGTNWFLGFSHWTPSKDKHIKEHVRNVPKIADVLEVFFKAGIDSVLGLIQMEPMVDAVKEAEQRTGIKSTFISTPWLPTGPSFPAEGWKMDEVKKILDLEKKLGATFCMPHMSVVDNALDRCTRKLRHFDVLCKMIRERDMIPALSTHMPETIPYADESGLDVETYIQIYNAMGFMMQLEVDWIHNIIMKAKKPVVTIKPMASGHIRPFQAFNFVWNTLREQDMVTVGCMTPDEAKEVIDLSLSILERKAYRPEMQDTPSKASVTTPKTAAKHQK